MIVGFKDVHLSQSVALAVLGEDCGNFNTAEFHYRVMKETTWWSNGMIYFSNSFGLIISIKNGKFGL